MSSFFNAAMAAAAKKSVCELLGRPTRMRWSEYYWSESVIVRSLDDVKASGSYGEKAGVWSSARYLLNSDDVGFTLTMTTVASGQSIELEYKNHVEANLIIEGNARLTDVRSGKAYQLGPGDMYTLDNHERHKLEALTDLKLVCVFTPALVGNETHDEDGSYPAC